MRPSAQSLKELKAKAHEAEQHAAQANAIFKAIGDGAIVTDQEGKISRINRVALRLLGYTEAEALGTWYPSLVVAEDREGRTVELLDRPITKAILTGKPVSQTSFYRTKNGSHIPVSLTVSPILSHGKPIGAINLFRDISYEFEVDKMKSEFISIASHQLRTPLSVIKTYSHMLEEFQDEPEEVHQAFLQIIIAATDRMNTLINTLLNVSRIEVGKIDLKIKPVDLAQLIDEVIEDLRPSTKTKAIRLLFQKRQARCLMQTDIVLVKEVITNLIANAIKYTPEKGKITVSLTRQKSNIRITITDNGYGIPTEAQKHIFSKFFRAPNVSDKDPSGSGLGLYMVKEVVERLGGKVWFKSIENEGTTFFVTIPLSISKKVLESEA